jgi:hypothetical protein
MNNPFAPLWRIVVFTGLALAASAGLSEAQTFLVGNYINNFDTGGNTTNFSGGGSVASWVYWYGTPGGSAPMTNDVSLDVNNNPNSGSLMVVSPFDTNPDQNVFSGTFGNGSPFDFSESADLLNYADISFYIRMAPGTPPRTNSSGVNLDFGTIGVGIITPGYLYQELGRPTIPLAASNSWVRLVVPIDYTQNNLQSVPGVAFAINSYSTGYPQFFMTNYIDSLQLDMRCVCEMPPPILSPPVKAIPGLNIIAADPAGENFVETFNPNVGFVGQPSVTYSWNIKSFPQNAGGNFQQQFFIVAGLSTIGQDNEPDVAFGNCLYMTIQQSGDGVAAFNFRYKTNAPGGNDMLFNTFSPGDTNNNPNGWPVEPYAYLNEPNGAPGTWSVTFAGDTNVTVTSPGGLTTNFTILPAVAALFADPGLALVLGGQPNNANGAGNFLVYSSFSATGCAAPINDNFLTDTTLNLNIWESPGASGEDTNGVILVPESAAYWVAWTLPDMGFSLQVKADLATNGGWVQPAAPIYYDNGQHRALIDSSMLPSATQGYFQLVEYQFTQLQVLLGGETSAPGTITGKTGTPTPVAGASGNGAYVTVTVNAVDPSFHLVPGVADFISFPSSTADPDDIEPGNVAMVNGTTTQTWAVYTTGNFTITAHDTTYEIPDATSSPVTITP